MFEIAPLTLYAGLFGSLIFLSYGEALARVGRLTWRFAARYDTRIVASVFLGAYFAPAIADRAPAWIEEAGVIYAELVEDDGVQRTLARLLSKRLPG